MKCKPSLLIAMPMKQYPFFQSGNEYTHIRVKVAQATADDKEKTAKAAYKQRGRFRQHLANDEP